MRSHAASLRAEQRLDHDVAAEVGEGFEGTVGVLADGGWRHRQTGGLQTGRRQILVHARLQRRGGLWTGTPRVPAGAARPCGRRPVPGIPAAWCGPRGHQRPPGGRRRRPRRRNAAEVYRLGGVARLRAARVRSRRASHHRPRAGLCAVFVLASCRTPAVASGGCEPPDSATGASGGCEPPDSATGASGGCKPPDSGRIGGLRPLATSGTDSYSFGTSAAHGSFTVKVESLPTRLSTRMRP